MAQTKQKQQDDQQDDKDQDQDQRPRLRRNRPRIFGSSRQPEDEPPVLLDWNGLARKGIRYHRNHTRKKWEAGTFPPPRHLSARKLVWLESEIDAWIAAQLEGGE